MPAQQMKILMFPKPSWAASKRPWDDAAKLAVIRYCRTSGDNVELERGVNFFIQTQEYLGAHTLYSCEGHPRGFYILFDADWDLAYDIACAGYFEVMMAAPHHPKNRWHLCFGHNVRNASFAERDKRRLLRAAAKAWQKEFLS